jgi:hypothetical protein
MRRLVPSLRDVPPLVVFLLLGSGVFALDRWLDDGDDGRRIIHVTAGQVAGIRERWAAEWGRPPTGRELQALLDEAVEEEILYREALRLGLDRDDAIVRRRLAQKMTFMLEDTAAVAPPSDREIETYHAQHAARYRAPGRTTFEHVFLSDDRRRDAARDAAALLAELGTGAGGDDRWRQLGDPFMLLREYANRTDPEIAELFGPDFATALSASPEGRWHGPIRSAYGSHLVRVIDRTESRLLPLDEVRPLVVEDLVAERRREQNAAAFAAVRERYEARMPPAQELEP